ncbi:hypothetical protein, partial [Proteus myxofaciens]
EQGGWIEKKENLSQEGDCFIYDDAMVFGYAQIQGNAIVAEDAIVYGNAIITDSAKVYGKAQVYGHAYIDGESIISENKHIFENIQSWNNIDSLEVINTNIGSKTDDYILYANGRHQIPIEIYFKSWDKKKREIKIEEDEIFENIEIVDKGNGKLYNDYYLSGKPGGFVYPEVSDFFDEHISKCTIYISTFKELDEILLDITILIKKKVFYLYNDIKIKVIPPRVYTSEDVLNYDNIQPIIEKDIGGYNCILSKYYIKLKNSSEFFMAKGKYPEDNWFYYIQKGNYKGCCTTTDNNIKFEPSSFFTKEFIFTTHWSVSVISEHHEEDGLCFWSYRIWHSDLQNYNEWGGEINFSLFDQYGNEAKMMAKVIEDEKLTFHFQ